MLIYAVQQKQAFCLRVWRSYKEINFGPIFSHAEIPPTPVIQVHWEDFDIENKCNKAILESFALACLGWLGAEIHHISTFL